MAKIPELLEMLQAGMHFGHQTSKWHPKMKPYIFSERNGVHVIDLRATQQQFSIVLKFVSDCIAKKGIIVFVGTKKQAQNSVKNAALSCGAPYVNERWLGGTLTNFSVISRLIQKYRSLKRKKEAGELEKYTKKEQLDFDREIERLEKLVGGISILDRTPNALFLVDIKKEKTALAEARKMHIPVIAICDSNTNPSLVDYPIPANDDALKSISLIANLLAQTIQEVKQALAVITPSDTAVQDLSTQNSEMSQGTETHVVDAADSEIAQK